MSQHVSTRERNRFEYAGHRRASPSSSGRLCISVIFSISRMTSRYVTHRRAAPEICFGRVRGRITCQIYKIPAYDYKGWEFSLKYEIKEVQE